MRQQKKVPSIRYQENPLRFVRDDVPDAVWTVERPPFARYQQLIMHLALAKGKFDSGEEPLEAVHLSLAGVIKFLHSDRGLLHIGLAEPLTLLLAGIEDTLVGAVPSLFVPKRPPENRPGGTTSNTARGHLAAILDARVSAGVRTGEAAEWLKSELEQRGFTLSDGKPITVSMLRRWREDVQQERAEVRVQKAFDRVKQKPPKRTDGTRDDLDRWCMARLNALTRFFPQTPHSSQGRAEPLKVHPEFVPMRSITGELGYD